MQPPHVLFREARERERESEAVTWSPVGPRGGIRPLGSRGRARASKCPCRRAQPHSMPRRKMNADVSTLLTLFSLFTCVYSRAFGVHRSGWKPGHKKHKYISDIPWDPVLKKREHLYVSVNESDECCPSVTEIVQPLGGVSKSGKILELYRDPNSTQSFYQTSCKEGVKGHPCKYIDQDKGRHSLCVQRYTYSYALVREFNSDGPWRLDYIRIRSGCSCEIRTHHHGRKRKRIEPPMDLLST